MSSVINNAYRRIRRLLLLPIVMLLGMPVYAQQDGQGLAAEDRIVLLISLDGFPAEAFEDPKLPVPTLRRLAREGVAAQGMRVSNPAVTWPNHTTLVTGVPPAKHGVLFNGLLVREGPRAPVQIEPWRDKAELVKATTVYDVAHEAGLTTAQVDWIPTLNAPTITWAFPEIPDPQGAVEQEMVADDLITEDDLASFFQSSPAWRDEYWTKAAVHLIEEHQPNLLLFHLLNLDAINHRYGPDTWAGHTAFAYADACVRQVIDALRNADLLDRATVLIVSDHGFKVTTKSVRPNAVLRQEGLLREGEEGLDVDAYVVPEGGTAMAFVTDRTRRASMVPQLKELFQATEGIARVLEPSDYAGLGLPSPEKNDQMGDLVLVAEEGYAFSGAHEGNPVVDVPDGGAYPGHHGYLADDPDMDALFIAWGFGIKPGAQLGQIDNVDVAPTVAALLGLTMGEVAGRPLTEILDLQP